MNYIGAKSYNYERILTGVAEFKLDKHKTRIIEYLIISIIADSFKGWFFNLNTRIDLNRGINSEYIINITPNNRVYWTNPEDSNLLRERYYTFLKESQSSANGSNLIAGCIISIQEVNDKGVSTSNIAHANALLVNAMEKTTYIFEPHGGLFKSSIYLRNLKNLIYETLGDEENEVVFLLENVIGPQNIQSSISSSRQTPFLTKMPRTSSIDVDVEKLMEGKKTPYRVAQFSKGTKSVLDQYQKALVIPHVKTYASDQGVSFSKIPTGMMEKGGFCSFWSLLAIHLVLMYRQQKKIPVILHELTKISALTLRVSIRLYSVWCMSYFDAYRTQNMPLIYSPMMDVNGLLNNDEMYIAFLSYYGKKEYIAMALKFCRPEMDGIISVTRRLKISPTPTTITCSIHMSSPTYERLRRFLSSGAQQQSYKKMSYHWNGVDIVRKKIKIDRENGVHLTHSVHPFFSGKEKSTLFQVQSSDRVVVVNLPKNIDQIRKYPLFLVPIKHRNIFPVGTVLTLKQFAKEKRNFIENDYYPFENGDQDSGCIKNSQASQRLDDFQLQFLLGQQIPIRPIQYGISERSHMRLSNKQQRENNSQTSKQQRSPQRRRAGQQKLSLHSPNK